MTELNLQSLDRLPTEGRPLIRPDQVTAGILHLGLGAFHRAHQAVYTERAIVAAGGNWGIIGVAPRSRDILERLIAQDGLYSVVTSSLSETRTRVVGSLVGLCHAASAPQDVIAAIADPGIRVVTLTVTEKAYRMDSAGRLALDDQLRAELTGATAPASIPALLARGLLARAAADAGPLAVVSCDNLQANGVRLRGMVEQALAVAGAGVPDGVTFPSTMVDRIVPATTEETLRLARDGLGVRDLAPVVAEPFRQWVIEDDFPGGRPAWELAGAVFTDDVAPWETLKLRVLNATHSALAYLGVLAGRETIADALLLPGARKVMTRLIEEDIAPTLSPPLGESPTEYGRVALDRFANPVLGHRTLQVAMDGTQKLPYRLLGTVTDQLRAGANPGWTALAVAAWMRFARGTADDGRRLPLNDPLADRIHQAVATAPDTPAGLAGALFGLTEVFDAEVATNEPFRATVVEWLGALDRHGAAATLAAAS
jgi:fructuronate reductase